jgi:hypothetical protein
MAPSCILHIHVHRRPDRQTSKLGQIPNAFVFVLVEVLSLCVQEVQLAARARRRNEEGAERSNKYKTVDLTPEMNFAVLSCIFVLTGRLTGRLHF